MKQANSVIYYSVFAALCGVLTGPVDAAVRVHNASRSYANAYGQVNAIRADAEYADAQYEGIVPSTGGEMVVETERAAVTLPVTVADRALAEKIAMADPTAPVSMDQLRSCSMIYPNGAFAWDRPTAGMNRGANATCVALVEMRGYQMAADGKDLVLARAYIASGDAIKCNISEFPEDSYTEDAGRVTFPADSEPTVDDVVGVMNEEQKQNAGFKIAAGAIIGAVGGNLAGKNNPGQDSMFGTGKDKMQSSLVGALSGATIAAGSAYTGKVAGDMIMSTGVNAAAGAVVGNMMASTGSGSTLRIERCKIGEIEDSCLWGVYRESEEFKLDDENGNALKSVFYNPSEDSIIVCELKNNKNQNCNIERLINIVMEDGTAMDGLDGGARDRKIATWKQFAYDKVKRTVEQGTPSEAGAAYFQVRSAAKVTKSIPAMIQGFDEKAFGSSTEDWSKFRASHKNIKVLGRNGDGTSYALDDTISQKIENFSPLKRDASSGGLIDISNKARMKGTLTGAGLGGAMGAFTAYQGAQKDIDERWVSAVREYKDSLSKIYCATGGRFLSQYNDIASIGIMPQ